MRRCRRAAGCRPRLLAIPPFKSERASCDRRRMSAFRRMQHDVCRGLRGRRWRGNCHPGELGAALRRLGLNDGGTGAALTASKLCGARIGTTHPFHAAVAVLFLRTRSDTYTPFAVFCSNSSYPIEQANAPHARNPAGEARQILTCLTGRAPHSRKRLTANGVCCLPLAPDKDAQSTLYCGVESRGPAPDRLEFAHAWRCANFDADA